MQALREMRDAAFRWREISCLFPAADGPSGLKPALDEVCAAAEPGRR